MSESLACFVSACYLEKIRLVCCQLTYFTQIINFSSYLRILIVVIYECSYFVNVWSQFVVKIDRFAPCLLSRKVEAG